MLKSFFFCFKHVCFFFPQQSHPQLQFDAPNNKLQINHRNTIDKRNGNPIFFHSFHIPIISNRMAEGWASFFPQVHARPIVVHGQTKNVEMCVFLYPLSIYSSQSPERTCAKTTNSSDAGVASSYSVYMPGQQVGCLSGKCTCDSNGYMEIRW